MSMWYVGEGRDRVVYSNHEVKGVCEKGQRLVRLVPDPEQFSRTIKKMPDGFVYYLDHMTLGAIVEGEFDMMEGLIEYYPRESVRAMRAFIVGKWGGAGKAKAGRVHEYGVAVAEY